MCSELTIIRHMVRKILVAVSFVTVVGSTAFAQQPPAPGAAAPATPAGQAPPPGRAGAPGTQGVGSQGDPDPGVHYLVVVDNPSVRVLQVTVQPGGVRREHVHNDVTFHMLVPITGALELTAGSTTAPGGRETIAAVPGQAYYMVKGQPHSFANKTAAPVQVIEVFVKGAAPAPWPVPFTAPAPQPNSSAPPSPGAAAAPQ
jgi:quercetin dioxygenase-like cupin family protein